MRKFAEQIIKAWTARQKKTVGRYRTDGTTVYAWGTPIATRDLDGRRYIIRRTKGDGSNHLIGRLRAAFPRAVDIEAIDMYYSTIYEPTIHYPPQQTPHKIRIGVPPRTKAKP